MSRKKPPLDITPRALTRDQVCAYLQIENSTLSRWIAEGIVPGPISGTERWDLRAIDRALDRRSRLPSRVEDAENDLDKALGLAR